MSVLENKLFGSRNMEQGSFRRTFFPKKTSNWTVEKDEFGFSLNNR